MIIILNIMLFLVNLYSIGVNQKKLDIIEDKLQDMAMLEERLKHYLDNLDSCFI